MALYLLDANVCIDALRDPYGPVAKAISDHMADGHQIITSTIVQYELEIGALKSARPSVGLARVAAFLSDGITILAWDEAAAHASAEITRANQIKGYNLQAYNALIAGHALSLGATLVSADARLTEAVDGVEAVSWR